MKIDGEPFSRISQHSSDERARTRVTLSSSTLDEYFVFIKDRVPCLSLNFIYSSSLSSDI